MTLLFVLSGVGSVSFVGISLCGPSQVCRAYRLLEMVGEGSPGHGPIHLRPAGAAEIGFKWDPLVSAWFTPA